MKAADESTTRAQLIKTASKTPPCTNRVACFLYIRATAEKPYPETLALKNPTTLNRNPNRQFFKKKLRILKIDIGLLLSGMEICICHWGGENFFFEISFPTLGGRNDTLSLQNVLATGGEGCCHRISAPKIHFFPLVVSVI